jgi:predicted nuclease of predicted toxin-antitoxin system
VNFLVDAQLPPALARWIASQGHQASHVFDLGFHTADDPVIWERARSESTVIISKDEDFVDHWLLSAEPVNCLDSERELLKPGFARLARTAVARRRTTIGAGREID